MLAITNASELPNGVVGRPYSFPLTAEGGDGTYEWSLTGRVPMPTQITVTIPVLPPGVHSVGLLNPDGQGTVLPDAFTAVAAPTIALISPTSGPAGGGGTMVITGDNIDPAAEVEIGSVPAVVRPPTP